MAIHPPMPSAKRKLLVILHGKAAGHPAFREAVQVIRGWGHDLQVRVTWEKGDAAQFAGEADRLGVDILVAAGGDGTLNEVVNGLAAVGLPPRCSLGVIPLGTANDFAVGLGIPTTDPLEAFQLILENEPQPIDLGRVNDRYFINVASGGTATQITHDTPETIKAVLGGVAYFLTGLAALPSLSPVPVQLRSGAWEWQGKVHVLAIGNGKQAGGGIPLCSQASLTDGLLDLMILPENQETDLISLFTSLLRLHLPATGHQTIYRQVPHLTLEAREPIQINLDGEPLLGSHFRFDVLQHALRFHLPGHVRIEPSMSELPEVEADRVQ